MCDVDVLCVSASTAVDVRLCYSKYLADNVGRAVQKFNFQLKRYKCQAASAEGRGGYKLEIGRKSHLVTIADMSLWLAREC